MKRIALAVVLSIFAVSSSVAQEGTCASKAVGKDGKALTGAALKSFMTKCTKDTCEPKAVGKDGKPLAGAAKAHLKAKQAGMPPQSKQSWAVPRRAINLMEAPSRPPRSAREPLVHPGCLG